MNDDFLEVYGKIQVKSQKFITISAYTRMIGDVIWRYVYVQGHQDNDEDSREAKTVESIKKKPLIVQKEEFQGHMRLTYIARD